MTKPDDHGLAICSLAEAIAILKQAHSVGLDDGPTPFVLDATDIKTPHATFLSVLKTKFPVGFNEAVVVDGDALILIDKEGEDWTVVPLFSRTLAEAFADRTKR